MCLEDVRIGRGALYTETVVAVGLTSTQVVTASPNCFSLVLGAPLTGTMTFSTVSPVVSGVGLNLSAGQPPIKLNLELDGAGCTKNWYAICSVAAQQVYVGQSVYAGQ